MARERPRLGNVEPMQVTEAIRAEHVEVAKERLIEARGTHLDSLVARRAEPRVRRVLAKPRQFVRDEGRLDLDILLREFAAFWVEQGESMAEAVTYPKAGAQLVFMAFLQRVVNGGGTSPGSTASAVAASISS